MSFDQKISSQPLLARRLDTSSRVHERTTRHATNTISCCLSHIESGSAVAQQSVSLTIAGQRLNIRTDRDEVYLQTLTEYVDLIVNDLQQGARRATPQVLLLALLKVADELFQARQRSDVLKDALQLQMQEIIGLIDGVNVSES